MGDDTTILMEELFGKDFVPNETDIKFLAEVNNGLSEMNRASAIRAEMMNSGGGKPFDRIFGYPRDVGYHDVEKLLSRFGVAERLLDKPATDTWADAPEICSAENQELVDTWNNIAQRNELWSVLHRADKLAGMDEYSVVIVTFEGDTDLTTPVDDMREDGQVREVVRLDTYPASSCPIESYYTDEFKSNYGTPQFYNLKRMKLLGKGGSGGQKLSDVKIHESRVLHIVENPLANRYKGMPRMFRHYNTLLDLRKVIGGSAEMFWNAAYNGFHVNVPQGKRISDAEKQKMSKEVFKYYNSLTRAIKTDNMEVTPLKSTTVDPTGVFNKIIDTLAIESEIPRRILLGTEAGELSSQQDRANLAVVIGNRRKLFAEAIVLNPLVRLLARAGALPLANDLSWKWQNSFKLNPLEISQRAERLSKAISNAKLALTPIALQMMQGMRGPNEGDRNASNMQTGDTSINRAGLSEAEWDALPEEEQILLVEQAEKARDQYVNVKPENWEDLVAKVVTEGWLREILGIEENDLTFDDATDITGE